MPAFTYKARNKDGHLMSAVIEAEDELQVATSLRMMGYSVVSIDQNVEAKVEFSEILQKLRKGHRREFIFFCRQLATLIHSGVSLIESLESIVLQTQNKDLREATSAVINDIKGGVTFSDALGKHPRMFPELFLSMVKVGETTGTLHESLERYAQLSLQELEMRTRIRSALVYPIILVVVAVVIVTFLFINIIPKFVVIFESHDAKLPTPTQILLGMSFFIRRLWFLALPLIAGGILWARWYLRSDKGRYQFDSVLFRLPIVGTLYLKIVIARFSRILGILTKSGVPLLQTLSVSEHTINNSVFRQIIQNIRTAVTRGQSLTDPMKASGVFPPMVIQMMSMGEKSGKLDQAMLDIAVFYEHEVDYAVKNLTTIIEPVLLLTIGGIVAFIALSVLLPIFNLIKVFRQ